MTGEKGRNPLVYAATPVDPNKVTVLFYGHYDVVPITSKSLFRSASFPLDLDGWNTNPFVMTSCDGFLYGRGTTDNKGPIVSVLMALSELMKEGTPLMSNKADAFREIYCKSSILN